MTLEHQGRGGFTLAEVLIASSILVVVMAMSVGGLTYMLRWTIQENSQDELDVQVQVAMEKLKVDMRLSALDQMVFYPQGNGPYTAVSFPIARDDDGDGAVERDAALNIIWDRTVIYHVWLGMPNELRVTMFDPRDNTLTLAQRQEQLESVVALGDGRATFNRAHARTTAIFRNLLNWWITPRGAFHDAYAPTLEREADVNLGFFHLTPGAHTITFRTIGRNSRATGYAIGLDTLVVSPSYSVREAEAMLPAAAWTGPAPTNLYETGGSFSANRILHFPALAPGDRFALSLYNDQWLEANFDHEQAVTTNRVVVEFDDTLSPEDFVVRLEGNETTWSAAEATRDADGSPNSNDVINGCAVRVLLRGADMLSGDHLSAAGAKCRVNFVASDWPDGTLQIDDAFIMETVSPTLPLPDGIGGTITRLKFDGHDKKVIAYGTNAWSDWLAFPIDPAKSYLVSYVVNAKSQSGHNRGSPWFWTEPVGWTNGSCWVWRASDTPEEAEAKRAVWSDQVGKVFCTNQIFAVGLADVSYVPLGRFESQPFDARMAAPVYERVDWRADVPDGCKVTLKVRSGSDEDMSDAKEWKDVTTTAAPGLIWPQAKRFAQFRAELTSDGTRLKTPRLRDVTVQWRGPSQVTDLGGAFVRSPTNGQFELLVDGTPLVTALIVDLEIFKEVRGPGGAPRRITSSLTAETRPLNTRK